MGYMRHHAIVVTSCHEKHIKLAHKKAKELLGVHSFRLSKIIESMMNDCASFFVAPDGSKEGWLDSEKGDLFRDQFVLWLRSTSKGYLRWVEVQYGDDEHETRVVRGDDV